MLERIEFKLFNKFIGFLKGTTFITFRDWKKHYFRKFSGFGMNSSIILELHKIAKRLNKQISIKIIVTLPDKTQQVWVTTPEQFLNFGYYYENEENGVKENQLILHRFFFEITG